MSGNSVSIIWHTQHDDRVCPICRAIDGYKWVFDSVPPESLVHPAYGEVWNVQMGSLAHEHQLHKGSKYGLISNCRCRVEGNIESLAGLALEIHNLKEELQELVGEEEGKPL